MSITGHTGLMSTGDHSGYIADRYRDGALSDTWTDVVRCARGTFVGFVPVCTCGWTGAIQPATVAGFQASQHALVTEHLSPAPAPSSCGGGSPHTHSRLVLAEAWSTPRSFTSAPHSMRA
ncbi:MAG: hypothetical protein M3Z25_01890 [Actinomycetota bacterium]|nr:hypothetical protein [Actinomycetota bacterium]